MRRKRLLLSSLVVGGLVVVAATVSTRAQDPRRGFVDPVRLATAGFADVELGKAAGYA